MCFQSPRTLDGVGLLPFETITQEENINKCLPPSPFTPFLPPTFPLFSPTALQVKHFRGGRKMFLALNYQTPFKMRYIPQLSLFTIGYCLFIWELGLLSSRRRCPVAVKFLSRSQVENQNHTARKRVVSSTYKAKQTVWHLSLGRRTDGSFGFSVFPSNAFNASYSVFYCHSCFLLLHVWCVFQ